MKIHILTQPLGHNYGGNLQAYALQKVLQKMGHDVVTLDRQYDCPKPTKKLIFLRIISACKSIIFKVLGRHRYICNPFSRRYSIYIDKSALQKNIRHNLNMSKPIYSSEEMENYVKTYPADAYIVGSDQVWRRAYCPSVSEYYLATVPDNVPKISYAASFGKDDISEYTIEEKQTSKKLIRRFKAVSVREESGVSICREHFDIIATKVLDPTLLLTSTEYLELLGRSRSPKKEHYIGVYLLDNSQVKQQIIKEMSSELNLPINEITINHKDDQYCKYPRVEDWIANIAYSDYVITDSFHGMVFSIIFEKQFLIIDNKNRGTARFESLLSQLGISERIVESSVSIPQSVIDYRLVKEKLHVARQESFYWLQSQLQ